MHVISDDGRCILVNISRPFYCLHIQHGDYNTSVHDDKLKGNIASNIAIKQYRGKVMAYRLVKPYSYSEFSVSHDHYCYYSTMVSKYC